MGQIKIRSMHISDAPWIFQQMLEFFNEFENGWLWHEKPSEETVDDWVATTASKGYGIIAEKDLEPVGFLTATELTSIQFPNAKMVVCSHWWVNKEYRNTRAGYMLLRKLKEYADMVSDITFITIDIRSVVSENTMRRLGFNPMSTVYSRCADGG